MQVGAIYSKKLFSLSVRPCLFLSVGHVLCATFPTILTSPSLPPTIPASSGVDHFSSAHNPPSELQLYLFFSPPPPAICDTNNSLCIATSNRCPLLHLVTCTNLATTATSPPFIIYFLHSPSIHLSFNHPAFYLHVHSIRTTIILVLSPLLFLFLCCRDVYINDK